MGGNKIWQFAGAFALAVVLAATGIADTPGPSGTVAEYGIYEYSLRDATPTRNSATTSGTVYKASTKPRLISQTDRIPIRRDIYFAFTGEFAGLPDGIVGLDWTVVHPKITTPDGVTSTGYTYTKYVNVNNGRADRVSGYMLNEDYEMVPGRWIFSYSYEGHLLVEQAFTVFLPDKANP